jgi:hypothetical protein
VLVDGEWALRVETLDHDAEAGVEQMSSDVQEPAEAGE